MTNRRDTENGKAGYEAAPSHDGGFAPSGSSSMVRLFIEMRQGDASATNRLFSRLIPDLKWWATGKLPSWARGRMDTDDLVQEALTGVFRRRDHLEPRRKEAIRAYLKRSILNRIRDEVRRARMVEVPGPVGADAVSPDRSPLDQAISAENHTRYVVALKRAPETDQQLIVGRVDLDYSYEQLALVTGKPTADAARMALRRALVRLAREMDADQR